MRLALGGPMTFASVELFRSPPAGATGYKFSRRRRSQSAPLLLPASSPPRTRTSEEGLHSSGKALTRAVIPCDVRALEIARRFMPVIWGRRYPLLCITPADQNRSAALLLWFGVSFTWFPCSQQGFIVADFWRRLGHARRTKRRRFPQPAPAFRAPRINGWRPGQRRDAPRSEVAAAPND